MIGRRRPDTPLSMLPDDVRRGDYWKVTDDAGAPLESSEPGNLTGTVWMVAAPLGEREGFGIGRLTKHTVRERDDGTIDVLPNDGSSNSIKIWRNNGDEFHGYIYAGEWRSV